MKKFFLLLCPMLLLTSLAKSAYPTGLTINFDNQLTLDWDTIPNYSSPKDTAFIENDMAVFVMDSSREFRVYGIKLPETLDLSSHRIITLQYKCHIPSIVQLAINDTSGIYGCYPVNFLPVSDTLATSYFSFNCESDADFTAIDSLFFVVVNTDRQQSTDTFYLDNILIGSDVILPEPEITGFTENFDDNTLSPGWLHYGPDTSYHLTETNQELQTVVRKNNWEGIVLNFPKLMDMSQNPNVSLRIKSKTAVPFRVYVMDYKGAYNTWNGIYHDNEWNVNVAGDSTYREYYFNFAGHFIQHFWNGMPSVLIDSTRIASIMFCVNPEFPFADTLWIDDVRAGDQANTLINHAPTIDEVAGMEIDSTSELQTILLTGISTGDAGWDTLSITAKCTPSKYITTPQISYTQGENTATLTFSVKRSGATTVTLTLTDNGTDYTNLGNSLTQVQFEVIVNQMTGIKEITPVSTLKLFPNPATEVLNIETSGEPIFEAKIIDQTGRIAIVQRADSDNIKINIHHLPRGIYLVELKSQSKVFRQKLIKE